MLLVRIIAWYSTRSSRGWIHLARIHISASQLTYWLCMDNRYSLAQLPTPIHRWNVAGLPKGCELWIKRDDLSGMQLSGNKVRKLEFLLAEAKVRMPVHNTISRNPENKKLLKLFRSFTLLSSLFMWGKWNQRFLIYIYIYIFFRFLLFASYIRAPVLLLVY